MKKFWIVCALIIATGLFAGYQYLFSAGYNWNQKIIVRVNTPDGMREGSSTIAVQWGESIGFLRIGDMVSDWRSDWRGEMPFVGLNEGKYIFAIFHGLDYSAEHALLTPLERKMEIREKLDRITVIGQAGVLPPEKYPLFVTFDDVNDPTSMKRADLKDWPELFGDGVELASIEIVITRQPRTKKIEAILPWLRQVSSSRFVILPGENRLMTDLEDPELETLTTRHFSTELTQ